MGSMPGSVKSKIIKLVFVVSPLSTHQDQGRIQDFKLGGGHLKKLRRAEGGAKIFGVFRVKNHDFTPKNHIFFNCGGRRENCWGISCEKSWFYAKKIIFFPILGGARRLRPPPPGSAPEDWLAQNQDNVSVWSDMSIRRLLFQRASTIKVQLRLLLKYKADTTIIIKM